jgi:CMP-N-acetylneuraminic acid synthetase
MTKNKEILALIPARGGSKGIPRKNIRPFSGHPLIAYSIAAARQAGLVNRVLVSTDDEEIAAIARSYGAETPFLRPAELAGDATPDLPVFQHALRWLAEKENYHPIFVIHLHATTPVRPAGCVDEAIQLLLNHPIADCVRSVVEAGQNPYKMWRVDEESGMMLPLLRIPGEPEPYNVPRQKLPRVYLQTGHVNAIRPSVVLGGSMSGKNLLPLQIDLRYLVDMDTPADWTYAEWLVGQSIENMVLPEEKK